MEMVAMTGKIHFSPEDQQFIDRAIDFCQRVGERAVLMLVGSRAANFADEWSDLDLCIIGDKRCLSDEDRRTYERSQQLLSIAAIMKPTGRFMMRVTCGHGWKHGTMK